MQFNGRAIFSKMIGWTTGSYRYGANSEFEYFSLDPIYPPVWAKYFIPHLENKTEINGKHTSLYLDIVLSSGKYCSALQLGIKCSSVRITQANIHDQVFITAPHFAIIRRPQRQL
jgi:hypothetical protein